MPKEALKIAILYDTWEEAGAPPAPPSDPPPPLRKGKRKPKKKEKEEREEIFDALVKLKHEPSYLILDGRDPSLASVIRSSADLFFNVTESYAGDDTKRTRWPAVGSRWNRMPGGVLGRASSSVQ